MKTPLLFEAMVAVVGAAIVSISAPNSEYVAKSTRNRNGESTRHSIFNYARRGHPEFADEERAWRKG